MKLEQITSVDVFPIYTSDGLAIGLGPDQTERERERDRQTECM
jgi:hypothetical protein